MKKIYILPAFSLAVCLTAAAKGSLGSGLPMGEELLRPILLAAGAREVSFEGNASAKTSSEENASAKALSEANASAKALGSNGAAPLGERTAAESLPEVKVSNLAEADYNMTELLSLPAEQKGGAVLIVHTHGCEAYAPSEAYSYAPSEDVRTTDRRFNVVRVGDEIEKVLTARGIKVIHDITLCDEPSFNDSYSVSREVVRRHLAADPDIKVVLDVHRDSIEGADGRPVKTDGGGGASGLMFVVGTDTGGAEHPLWRQNMAFALRLHRRIEAAHPGIMRPLNLRGSRFNQQLSTGSLIVEVGSDANTLDEALAAARIFAESLADEIS